jgi:hypothetical protein
MENHWTTTSAGLPALRQQRNSVDCRLMTSLLVSFVFCFAQLHQIMVIACHRVRHEPLLADFTKLHRH